MKNCMNVAAGVFGVMVPVALLVCGWNVLAPEKWCWVERGISIWGGAIATAFLFLFAAGYEHEKKDRVNAPRNAQRARICQRSISPPAKPLLRSAKSKNEVRGANYEVRSEEGAGMSPQEDFSAAEEVAGAKETKNENQDMKFKGRDNRTAYSLGLRVQPPLPSSGDHQES